MPKNAKSKAKVRQFCAVTGATEEVAEHILEACDGKLDEAIDLHTQSSSSNVGQTNGSMDTPSSNGREGEMEEEDDVRAPIQPTSGVLMPHSYAQVHGTNGRPNGQGSVFDADGDYQSESNAEFGRQKAVARGGKAAKAQEHKKRDLQALFRPPVDMMAVGDFDDVKRSATKDGKWLLINVQDVTEFACQILNRDVWSNAAVKDIVLNNMLFWQTLSDSGEGARVMAYYKVREMPFVALIDPRTGELVKAVPCNDAPLVADTLTSFVCDYPTLSALDEQRARSKKTKVKVNIIPPTPQQQHQIDRRAKRAMREEENEKVVSNKRAREEDVEMVQDWSVMMGTSESTVTLLLRLPSGGRHRQTFPSDTRVSTVRTWATAMGIEHGVEEMVVNYPQRSFDDMKGEASLEASGLATQETIMMSTEELQRELTEIDDALTDCKTQLDAIRRRQSTFRQRKHTIEGTLTDRASASTADVAKWDSSSHSWSEKATAALTGVYKLAAFRPLQRRTINALLGKEDVLLVMSTGGGKSLCYQLPSVVMGGLTLVVSPLVSLMHDQLTALRNLGINAAQLTHNSDKVRQVYTMMETTPCPLRLLYVTAERVAKSKMLMNKLEKTYKNKRLTLIAIDEVHCCSQWGHDFRPDYKTLNILRRQFAGVPIVGVTATATASVIDDVKTMLGIPGALVFRAPFNRANLDLIVRPKPSTAEETIEVIGRLCKEEFAGQTGIVYVFSRAEADNIAKQLADVGVHARSYHAQLSDDLREQTHDRWTNGHVQVIVATIAFGMGIDKSDVRFVIHQTMSKSMENYYQEAGRAGRDGRKATCIVLYRLGDVFRQSTMVCQSRTGTAKLYDMLTYCVNSEMICRRRLLARHFDEVYEESWCDKQCDACRCEISADESMDAAKAMRDISTVLAGSEDRLTAAKLLDKWAKLTKSSSRRPAVVYERTMAMLLLDGQLVEDFHYTPYSIISYISAVEGGSKRARLDG